MPTVLLLDVSLSMTRPVPTSDATESINRLTIASAAINTFLDYLSVHSKLEYVALVSFSSAYEVVVPFTRDYDSIRAKLPVLEEGDKTCIEQALAGVNQLILNEWGYQTPVQVVLITDGSCGVGAIGRARIIPALPLPPSFPVKIHVLPVVSPHDPCLQQAMPLYQKIVELASTSNNNGSNGTMSRGAIYCPEQLTVVGATTAMTRLCEQQYQEFWCSLKCGQLEARVQLFPPPQPAVHEATSTTCTLAHQLHVVGFLTQQELGMTPGAPVQLFPPPQPAVHEATSTTCTLAHQLHVVGFLTQQELGMTPGAPVQLFPPPQPAVHEATSTTCTLAHQLHVVGFLTQQELGMTPGAPVQLYFFYKQ
ncbi:von willebrand factor type A domain-containing protein [Phthorimaea operculella]|nr:von willebrand factor type A domain-containing protein [Phthorimaea operculella]